MTDFWNAWNWNPLIGAGLALVGWRYMDGVWSLWLRAGAGRGVRRWQVAAFWSGMAFLFIALISPVDTWSIVSLSMHMVQHLLLTIIAPPLLVLGLPPAALIRLLPGRWRQGTARWWLRQRRLQQFWHRMTAPLYTWCLFALVLWTWHLPPLYEAAVLHPAVHLLEHLSFFGSALGFWWGLKRYGVIGVLLVFTTALHTSILGALLTFSTQIWYPIYSSLEDQQFAGLIMWMPGGVVFLVAGLLLVWHWLYEMESSNAQIVA